MGQLGLQGEGWVWSISDIAPPTVADLVVEEQQTLPHTPPPCYNPLCTHPTHHTLHREHSLCYQGHRTHIDVVAKKLEYVWMTQQT